MNLDAERVPVVIASGQCTERHELVTPVDLMTNACEAALADAPLLRQAVDQLSVVSIMTPTGPAPASELAARLGIEGARLEVSTIGGNTPQWLVSRAASAIAAGSLGVTVIAGAEALRSHRARRLEGLVTLDGGSLAPDEVVGDRLSGTGPAEAAIELFLPVHIYPLFESAIGARFGRSAQEQRRLIGRLFSPFTEVAAKNPLAWFQNALSAEVIATPTEDNRMVSDPYTKRMTAFLGSDQAGALIVCSLAAARRAGVAERAVFVWSGAETTEVRFPTARPDLSRSPAIEVAGSAVFEAAGIAGSRTVGVDEIDLFDIYSCFPSAVEMAAEALGLEFDDRRGLTATGGLPYFGGPGNNYTTHGIAEVTSALRAGGGSGAALGLVSGLGWYVTKHAFGIYGTSPPPAGFRRADTKEAQARVDGTAVEVALEVEAITEATVIAATVIRDKTGNPTGAPAIVVLPDGRHMAALPEDDEVTAEVGARDVTGLIGTAVAVQPGAPRYRLPNS